MLVRLDHMASGVPTAVTSSSMGIAPVAKSDLGANAPPPVPSTIETELELELATTRSTMPSPFMSARSIHDGEADRLASPNRLIRPLAAIAVS